MKMSLLVLVLLAVGPLASAESPTLVTLDPSQVKLKVIDSDSLLKTNDSAKVRHYIGMQNGVLVTQETAVEGAGPFCMFALGPKSSREIPQTLQATKIEQGAPMAGLMSLAIYTEGDYLLVCTMNNAYYSFRKDETNATMRGFLSIEAK